MKIKLRYRTFNITHSVVRYLLSTFIITVINEKTESFSLQFYCLPLLTEDCNIILYLYFLRNVIKQFSNLKLTLVNLSPSRKRFEPALEFGITLSSGVQVARRFDVTFNFWTTVRSERLFQGGSFAERGSEQREMSSGVIDILVDMGFSMSKAEKALEITGNKGVEPAMEWLLAHSDEAEPGPAVGESAPTLSTDSQDNVAGASSQPVSTTESAKSMKCDVCGKLFKSNLEVEFHATKSGHDRFSESTEEKKPLTEEEKREQLKMLEEKLRQKRKEREEQEKKNAFEREKNRIRSGKEMSEARKKLEELEMQKLLEQRKREKAEEKEARQRVRAQIEADKAARRAKAAAESNQVVNTTSVSLSAIPSSTSTHHRKDYTETRLQLRLTNGQTLTQSFGSKEQLSAVRLFIEMNRTDDNGPFQLMTTFPKKVFTDEDYDTPLDVLGLVPSAVVIVQKKTE